MAIIQNLYGLTGGCQGSTIRPTNPDDFTASGISTTEMLLTWTEAGDPEYIQIERSLTDSDYVPLIEMYPGIETYTDTELASGTQYYYRFRCKKRVKWSDYVYSDDSTSDEE